VSAKAGWYPDPGGGQGLYRYWDGKSWSAATSPNPGAPPPTQGLASIGQPASGSTVGQTGTSYGQPSGGFGPGSGFTPGSGFGSASQPAYGAGTPSAYANYQQLQKKKSPVGWWIAGAALVVVIIVVAVIAIRAVSNGAGIATPSGGGGPVSQDACPPQKTATPVPEDHPNDGRVHGGPISYPTLAPPWGEPETDFRVPFGSDVLSQQIVVEPNYATDPNTGERSSWVASVLVGELQAGDGFFTPEQGSQIVVKCILGAFYGNAEVGSDVRKNQAITVDGHEGWLVESHLSFDIPGLKTKGEQLIVVIVSAGARSGLYYASIPDTRSDLLPTARDLIKQLKVTE
jgi:Protein of unknown function (DUF2510)